MPDIPVPPFIGRYRVDAVLGEGAMGIVYKGHDPAIDRPVALKLVHTDLLRGQEAADFSARFRREARAAGRCHHPNIVAVYDFAEHEGQPFIAMEYVEGNSLQSRLGRLQPGTRLDRGEALSIIQQVLEALACAHAAGIVHRDIKPANIILLRNGTVKVADFGVSRIEGAELAAEITQLGTVIGSPSYMSPEQCRGDPVDPRSDLFSTGVVLFELLSGERAFPGSNITQVLSRLLTYDLRDFAGRLHDVPRPLADAVLTALERDPVHRFGSAQVMAERLKQAATSICDGATVLYRAPDGSAARTGTGPAGRSSMGETGASRSGTSDSGTMPGMPQAVAAADLSLIEKALAQHLGPIAKVLVKRELRTAQNVAELCDKLASHLDRTEERDTFRSAVRRGVRGG